MKGAADTSPHPPAEQDRCLLFCITGSIAATNSPLLLQMLLERRIFARIQVAISQNALRFVREEPFVVMSRQRCITDIFDDAAQGRPLHVHVSKACQYALVAPASGDFIGKLAHGIVDDTVTNLLSVFEGQLVIAPAIHPITSRKPSFQRNLEQVRADGALLCGPVKGYSMSEGKRGSDLAAMPSPEFIAAYLEYLVMEGRPPDVELD